MNNETNPFADPNGHLWQPGKQEEWENWNREQWKRHLATLTPNDRQQAIESKLRLQHRMQSEAGRTPDFDTWKVQAVAQSPWILG